jgi:hypothetical protein
MRRVTFLLGLGLTLLWAQAATALTFRIIPDDGLKRQVLLVYDCGWLVGDPECLKHESSFAAETSYFESYSNLAQRDAILSRIRALRFQNQVFPKEGKPEEGRIGYLYSGDGKTLVAHLNQNNFAEVWLLSGGGHVVAGLDIARAFRERGVAVRVPSAVRIREARLSFSDNGGAECVSACTIAFMGGVLRSIDEGASYQIHAASIYSGIDEARLKEIHETLAAGGKGLQAIADGVNKDARDSLRKGLINFQDTLLLPLGERNTRAERLNRDAALSAWVIASRATFPYSAAQRERDRQIIEIEGDAALQDIFMRLEREAIALAVEDVRPLLPKLGRRADAALAMFVAMFDTASIKESNMMARETLVSMGYITEDVK